MQDVVTKRALFRRQRLKKAVAMTPRKVWAGWEEAPNLNDLMDRLGGEEEFRRNRDLIRRGQAFTGTASWIRPDGLDNVFEFSARKVGPNV